MDIERQNIYVTDLFFSFSPYCEIFVLWKQRRNFEIQKHKYEFIICTAKKKPLISYETLMQGRNTLQFLESPSPSE